MCLRKKYQKISKYFKNSDLKFNTYVYVPCRRCSECIEAYKNMWAFRASQEYKDSVSCHFLTLTYDDDHLPANGVNKRDIQLFFKRLRKKISTKYPEYNNFDYKLKYFLGAEYGSKYQRPHYHAVLFNCPLDVDDVAQCWQNGFIQMKSCNSDTIRYCLKYFCFKSEVPEGKNKTFLCMSKKIGINWVLSHPDYNLPFIDVNAPNFNYKLPIPRYFKEKLKDNYEDIYTPDYRPKKSDAFSSKFLKYKNLSKAQVDEFEEWQFFNLRDAQFEYYTIVFSNYKKKFTNSLDNQ